MRVYIARRVLQAIVTLFMLSILFFMLVRFQPVSPCSGVSEMGCTEALKLDQPLATQYLSWLSGIAHFNFGNDVRGQPIGTLILEKLPPTILLVSVSLVFQQLIALPLGILAALRPYSVVDGIFTLASYMLLSIPAFLAAFFLMYVFSIHWELLPVGRYEDPAVPILLSGDWFGAVRQEPGYVFGDLAHHLILPVIALTATGIAVDSRFMRAAMLQVMRQEYMRTARAKGLSRRTLIFKHAFRNALLPIITNLGLYIPAMISGVVVIEDVFSWGGVGNMFSTAIQGSGYSAGPDFTVVQALAMLSALAVVIANLLADLVYAWLDPRIRFESGESA